MEPINFQYVNIDNSTITNDGRHLQVTLTRNESGKHTEYIFESHFNKNSFVFIIRFSALNTKDKKSNQDANNTNHQQLYIEISTKDIKDIQISTMCFEKSSICVSNHYTCCGMYFNDLHYGSQNRIQEQSVFVFLFLFYFIFTFSLSRSVLYIKHIVNG